MIMRKLAFYSLVSLSLFALYLFSANLDPSPEAKIMVGGMGGAAVMLLAPFWVLYRGKVPLFAAISAVMLTMAGIIFVNCWAAGQGGTRYTHPGDYTGE